MTDIPRIEGIPEIPGAKPFIGHLHLHGGASGFTDARFWTIWGEKLNSELLQVRFGNKRVVIANSFNMVRELFVGHANQTSGRPRQYIFKHFVGEKHPPSIGVVCRLLTFVVGFDLGTSPLEGSFKRQRTAGIKAAQPRQWPLHHRMLAREGYEVVQALVDDGDYGEKPIFVLELFRKVSMNIAFQLTFGKRFRHQDDPWLLEYTRNAKKITKFVPNAEFCQIFAYLDGTGFEEHRIPGLTLSRSYASFRGPVETQLRPGSPRKIETE